MHEIDLNTGNLLIDRLNRVIKIDGDWSIAALTHPELLSEQPNEITPNLLSALPYLPGYFAYNWLDIRQFGEDCPSQIFDDELLSAPHYRAEINQAILKLLFLPEAYIRSFIGCYLDENKEQFISEFLIRRAALKESAMALESFCTYLDSPEAVETIEAHFNEMQAFSVNQWFPVLEEDERALFLLEFRQLQKEFAREKQHSPDTVAFDSDNGIYMGGAAAVKDVALSVSNQHRLFQKVPSASSGGGLLVKRTSTCSDLAGLGATY